MITHEIHTVDDFLKLGVDVRDAVIHAVDFFGQDVPWEVYSFDRTVFLGCRFSEPAHPGMIIEAGGTVFPRLPGLPYAAYRQRLYTWQELREGWTESADGSLDRVIYDHFVATGRFRPDILNALAQRVHDHGIDDALRDLVEGRHVVGIMGGHKARRDEPTYHKAAQTALLLTRAGYFVASGGGPGVMEAANLGAWLAPYGDDALEQALHVLQPAPTYEHPEYVERALEVLRRYPDGAESLAVPTWFYGHEPSNVFGTHIAKYFSNSLREDALLAVCTHGIVFAPGSAGTTQEIFQDAAQNHYGTFGHIAPMVFLGSHRYADETSLYATLKQLSQGHTYGEMMALTDTPAEVVTWLERHPPVWNPG